jgi:hypothetical protein
MTTARRTRPAASPAYYLGRPARVWRTALHRRARPAPRPDMSEAIAQHRNQMVARDAGTIR